MDYKGLMVFSIGGTVVLLVIWSMIAYLAVLQNGLEIGPLISFGMIFGFLGFIGFLIAGLGLQYIIKNSK